MNRILELMAQADNQLQSISVRGDDAFAMVAARKLMRTAYDLIRREAENHADERKPTAVLDGGGDSGD